MLNLEIFLSWNFSILNTRLHGSVLIYRMKPWALFNPESWKGQWVTLSITCFPAKRDQKHCDVYRNRQVSIPFTIPLPPSCTTATLTYKHIFMSSRTICVLWSCSSFLQTPSSTSTRMRKTIVKIWSVTKCQKATQRKLIWVTKTELFDNLEWNLSFVGQRKPWSRCYQISISENKPVFLL